MLRLSANISTLFTERPALERPAAAANRGFAGVEMQFPYSFDASALRKACDDANVDFVMFNLPAGNEGPGELGLACLPDRCADFNDGLELALRYAAVLRCSKVNCLAGDLPPGLSRDAAVKVLVENLRRAADVLAARGVQLLLEPLNRTSRPRTLLAGACEADEVLQRVNHPNLFLQFDVFHAHAAGEDWMLGLKERLDRIGHIQFSDWPGRGEPGTGKLDLQLLFETLSLGDYVGWTGCEYWPTAGTDNSFGWLNMVSVGREP